MVRVTEMVTVTVVAVWLSCLPSTSFNQCMSLDAIVFFGGDISPSKLVICQCHVCAHVLSLVHISFFFANRKNVL